MTNTKITDPDGIVAKDKQHAVKFETYPGQWTVVHLDDDELMKLFRDIVRRMSAKGMFVT